MAKISISEAARLTGKNRSTLHRHINAGKLSKEFDTDNNPVLDTSELARVYPSFKVSVVGQQAASLSQSNNKQQVATVHKTDNTIIENELLKLKLQNAEEKITIEESRRREVEQREREGKEEIRRLLGIVEKHTYLLAAPQKLEEVHPEQKQEQAKVKKWKIASLVALAIIIICAIAFGVALFNGYKFRP